MKRLPIAKTEIKEIAEGNFCYADKTRFIKDLVDDGHTYYFLSRPRRFGKSLFVDTLRAAFAGEKDSFKGLFLENNWEWNVKYPVISISFGAGTVETKEELNLKIDEKLNFIKEKYQLGSLINKTFSGRFEKLIELLNEKFNLPVVVLIDEYDKPILDNITKENVAEIREQLSSFYSVLKDSSRYLKFVFLTGVSRFSKTSIFSKLNNITDISLVEKYADICGITQHDLETVFADYLKDVDLEKVKEWYDGYNFGGSNLYNPYDVLMFLWEKRYKPYWFETGTPTFLLELIKQKQYFLPEMERVDLADTQLAEFDVSNIELNVLLFQAGYLTIHNTYQLGEHIYYTLKIPNNEVRLGLNDYLLRMFYTSGSNASSRSELYKRVYYAISQNRPQDLEPAFISFFESIPHDWYRNNDIAHFEGFFSSMFYAFFAAQGFHTIPEDTTSKGKIDLTILTNTGIFIFEFKMKTNPKNALQQIQEKKYQQKYLAQGKEVFLVGIEFDEVVKNISGFEWKSIINNETNK